MGPGAPGLGSLGLGTTSDLWKPRCVRKSRRLSLPPGGGDEAGVLQQLSHIALLYIVVMKLCWTGLIHTGTCAASHSCYCSMSLAIIHSCLDRFLFSIRRPIPPHTELPAVEATHTALAARTAHSALRPGLKSVTAFRLQAAEQRHSFEICFSVWGGGAPSARAPQPHTYCPPCLHLSPSAATPLPVHSQPCGHRRTCILQAVLRFEVFGSSYERSASLNPSPLCKATRRATARSYMGHNKLSKS